MKKLFIVFSAALALFSTSAIAQTSKQMAEAKKMARQDKKNGFECENGNLETLLAKYFIAKRDEGMVTLTATGIANESRFKNLGKQIAKSNAAFEYSQSQRSIIEGKIVSAMNEINSDQSQTFIEGYESRVLGELSGQMKTAAWVVRKDPTNPKQFEIKGYFYIDEEAARQAHLNALRSVAEEQKLINEIGQEISDWVKAIPSEKE